MKKTPPICSLLARLLLVALLAFASIGTSLTALCTVACGQPGSFAMAPAGSGHACCSRAPQASRSVAAPACVPLQQGESAGPCEMLAIPQVNGAVADAREYGAHPLRADAAQTFALVTPHTSSPVFAAATHSLADPPFSLRLPLRI